MSVSDRGGLDLQRLAAARLVATRSHPYLAEALYALTPIARPGLGTFAVDDAWRLYIDPRRLARWSIPEVAGVLLHEVSHVVRAHGDRARAQGVSNEGDAERWNYAADAEINDDLHRDGVTLPQGVLPKHLGLPRGRTAEYYYAHLVDRGHEGRPLRCGSGATGVHAAADHESSPVDQPGLSRAAILLVVRRVAEQILVQRRTAGSVPAGWVRWAEAVVEPVLDWRRLLHAHVRRGVAWARGASDYRYGRPSRRQFGRVVQPSMRRPLPSVAVVIDTSGSMDDARLGMAWSEVQECLRLVGVRRDLLRVVATDVVALPVDVRAGMRTALPGGGGTDLRVGFEAAQRLRPRPHLLVVITDGETPWPDSPPSAHTVIVLLPHDNSSVPFTPPWARTVVVPTER